MSITARMFHGRDDRLGARLKWVQMSLCAWGDGFPSPRSNRKSLIFIDCLTDSQPCTSEAVQDGGDASTAFIYPRRRRDDRSRARRDRLAGCPYPLANQHPWTRTASPGQFSSRIHSKPRRRTVHRAWAEHFGLHAIHHLGRAEIRRSHGPGRSRGRSLVWA